MWINLKYAYIFFLLNLPPPPHPTPFGGHKTLQAPVFLMGV